MERKSDWQARYESALRQLDSSDLVVRMAHAVASVDMNAPPTLYPVTGATDLTGMRRVGLAPGSYNPLTLAHVALVEAARVAAGLAGVVWAFAGVTVDKERVARAALPDRLAQLAAYIRWRRAMGDTDDTLALLNRGLYVDQARAVRSQLAPDAELFILVGFDKIVQIFDPHYYDDRDTALRELFAEAHLLVAPRASQGEAALRDLLARPHNAQFAAHVSYLPVAPEYATDSSTAARRRAASGLSDAQALRDLLPPEAVALVQQDHPYAPTTKDDPYTLRQAWIAALQHVPSNTLKQAPSLSQLVALAGEKTKRGARIRSWLRSPPTAQTVASLTDPLALLREIGAL
ncbi:MAG: hypothetical protein ABI068_13625 [Ktedonobacterales bacterium]